VTRRRGPFPNDHRDPEQSGLFLYLNADKRGVTLDLSQPAERAALDAILAGADILIHNLPPPQRAATAMESAALCARFPALIVTAISAYGGFGPRANYHAYDLNAQHASGLAGLTPRFPFPNCRQSSFAAIRRNYMLACTPQSPPWEPIGIV
jgi:CoA:oxalate CoA-transferase